MNAATVPTTTSTVPSRPASSSIATAFGPGPPNRIDSCATTEVIRSCGQPCTACHTSVGDAISAPTSAAHQNAGRRSIARGPATPIATTSTAPSRITWNFVSAARPSSGPTARSSRSSRTRVQRTSSHSKSAHCSGSSEYGVTKCPNIVTHSPVAWASAVSTWALRSPPSSRAISAATTTAPAVDRDGTIRSTPFTPGARASASPASAGATGGWSADPQSRW